MSGPPTLADDVLLLLIARHSDVPVARDALDDFRTHVLVAHSDDRHEAEDAAAAKEIRLANYRFERTFTKETQQALATLVREMERDINAAQDLPDDDDTAALHWSADRVLATAIDMLRKAYRL
jgi:formate dehydrogenase maturation protein FdhE